MMQAKSRGLSRMGLTDSLLRACYTASVWVRIRHALALFVFSDDLFLISRATLLEECTLA